MGLVSVLLAFDNETLPVLDVEKSFHEVIEKEYSSENGGGEYIGLEDILDDVCQEVLEATITNQLSLLKLSRYASVELEIDCVCFDLFSDTYEFVLSMPIANIFEIHKFICMNKEKIASYMAEKAKSGYSPFESVDELLYNLREGDTESAVGFYIMYDLEDGDATSNYVETCCADFVSMCELLLRGGVV